MWARVFSVSLCRFVRWGTGRPAVSLSAGFTELFVDLPPASRAWVFLMENQRLRKRLPDGLDLASCPAVRVDSGGSWSTCILNADVDRGASGAFLGPVL